ncbi:MAG: DUF4166 domain-containing protein [Anaerolineales bacterium]
MSSQLHHPRPAFSPLEPVFAEHAGEAPSAFREQFLHSPQHPYRVRLEGTFHYIWHKPGLTPLFKLLGRMGILVSRTGQNVSAQLDVIAGLWPNGEPYHEWNRTLHFEPPIHFNTTVVYDIEKRDIGDLVGWKNSVYLVWRAKFHLPSLFTLDSAHGAFRLAGRTLWLPRWLWPFVFGVVSFTQRMDETRDDTVHVDLRISHPLLGAVFAYTGTFRAVRLPKEDR